MIKNLNISSYHNLITCFIKILYNNQNILAKENRFQIANSFYF